MDPPDLKHTTSNQVKRLEKTLLTNSRKLETWPSSTPLDTSRSFNATTTSTYAEEI